MIICVKSSTFQNNHVSVLPVYGARDIRSMSYDPLDGLIYWIDNGSRKKDTSRIAIKRAFTNGTLLDRKLQVTRSAKPPSYNLQNSF
jgi:hypothetical protein